jgi:phosphate transport system substrate-binding protein
MAIRKFVDVARRWPQLAVSLAVTAVLAATVVVGAPPASAADLAAINGSGSTYVGLAMQQWTAEGQAQGLNVNYTPTGSPDGLQRFGGGQIDFAGTEAEFSSLSGSNPSRGFQYVPDVAGAVAIMYNIKDVSGRKVDYLHLSRSTIAKIFMGYISNWNDPQIAADNSPANLKLPDLPINVVYRSGQSGTTALFYDFVQHIEPGLFSQWAAANQLPTQVRILALDSSVNFAPKNQAVSGSDQMAQLVASDGGYGSIAYDEFGYAKVYNAPTAWVQNGAGFWVQPYAVNISAALDGATLRPDLSQELSGVYNSTNQLAYPISAYSYIVTQCAKAADRASCAGNYANLPTANTLSAWLRYIACNGQIKMAQIGYSPLPPNLSQEVANSIGRMNGVPPEQLNAGNCPNPRFSGTLGIGAQSPPDPFLTLAGFKEGSGGNSGGSGNGSGGSGGAGAAGGAGGTNGATDAGGGSGTDSTDSTTDASGAAAGSDAAGGADAAGRAGASKSAGGGSTDWKKAVPVVYAQGPLPGSALPAIALLLALGVPVAVASFRRRRHRPATASGSSAPPPPPPPPPPPSSNSF